MPSPELLSGAITMLLGAAGALIGAVLLWKFWAFPRIRGWIFDQGSAKLKAWIDDIVQHPEGAEAERMARMSGVLFAHLMVGITEQLSTKEGREVWSPIWQVVREHVMGAVFATWGHILQDLQNKGMESGIGGAFQVPDFIGGIAQKMFPGVDPKQLLQAASWLTKLGGDGNGTSFSSPGPSQPAHSRGGMGEL